MFSQSHLIWFHIDESLLFSSRVGCKKVIAICRFGPCIISHLPIVGQVAIAGLLANKKYTPESAGTLKTDTVTFGVMTFCVIVIVAALSFFPAQTLGPIAEYFSIY